MYAINYHSQRWDYMLKLGNKRGLRVAFFSRWVDEFCLINYGVKSSTIIGVDDDRSHVAAYDPLL